MGLLLTSLFTLGLLFAFLFAIILGIFYALGIIQLWIVIALTGIAFLLQWLLSPYFSDIVFRWLYGLRWIGIDELRRRDEEVAKFVEETCKKHRIKVPRIGFIDDDNPQAFCYGSAAFNARLVFTQGIFTYLNTDERKAVFAHEIGHIVHRDFIVMTLAAFIIAVLYHLSRALLRTRGRRRGTAALVGAIAYFFYFVGTYVLLFLSRVREYFADEFAAKEMRDSNPLAKALLKVAYGIIARPEEKRQLELMRGTRTLGIMDFKAAKGVGLAYLTSLKLKSWEPVKKVFLFDLYNPWAFICELNSTHPLVAKRIRRLDKLYNVREFEFEKLKNLQIDRSKLYAGFLKDLFFQFLPLVALIIPLVIFVTQLKGMFPLIFPGFGTFALGVFSVALISLGASFMVRALYKYPKKSPEGTTILNLAQNPYASPIRGKTVKLKGKIVGRGVPGLILSEDMMFQDETGLIYLNYEGIVPIFSNLMFALLKINKFVGEDAEINGWFFRGLSTRIELKEIVVGGKRFKSYARFWEVFTGILILCAGIFLFLLLI